MKRVLSLVAAAVAGTSIAWSSAPAPAPPAPLTSIHAIRSLTDAQADQGLPVAFEGTVTFFRGYQNSLFIQDGSDSIYVWVTTNGKLVPGDRVLVKGKTKPSFRTVVLSDDITLLSHGGLPKAVSATFDELIRGERDSMLVTVRATVRAADLVMPSAAPVHSTMLRMLMAGGNIDAYVDSDDASALNDLIGAEVEVTAVAGAIFDGKMQQTGVVLRVSRLADIKVMKHAATSPWSIPVTPMDKVMRAYHVENLTSRVRVHGTITYYEPGSAVVLQSGAKSLWIKTQRSEPLHIGDLADATGFPSADDGFLTLVGSEIQDSQTKAPIAQLPLPWKELASSRHIFDLVSTEGELVMEAREGSQDEYILASDGHLFSAIFRHAASPGSSPLAPMKRILAGSKIRVSGICVPVDANATNRSIPFNILLRSADDVEVLSKPSPLTVRNLGTLVVLLLMAMLAFGARAWLADRTMRTRLAELGYLGQRRSEILEDINKSKPLSETLERITELASASLKGAPCWCQITDGVRLGNRPSHSGILGMRIVEHAIAAHSGSALGSIFAAFDVRTTPQIDEDRALATAAELATLAIETSRLHTDLVHRSEFDMLTEIENRFSFEKHLDDLFDEARGTSGVFGIIYIDLNDFKKVNDLYGHHFGDVYLQNVAARMKHQLRPGDLLARLGGDEFGVLLPAVRGQVDVEEITLRLERCFDAPFVMGSHTWRGSASFGTALYPEDADTKESLLRCADAAMYVAKHGRRQLS
jgi:diguanylate cyclase (GGDEF)-like protein